MPYEPSGSVSAVLSSTRPRNDLHKMQQETRSLHRKKNKGFMYTTRPQSPHFEALPSERRRERGLDPHHPRPRGEERLKTTARARVVAELRSSRTPPPPQSTPLSARVGTPAGPRSALATACSSPGRSGATPTTIWRSRTAEPPGEDSAPATLAPYYSYASPAHFRTRAGRMHWLSGYATTGRSATPPTYYKAPWRSDQAFVSASPRRRS